MPRITLLTDFGTADGYVGAMKGVMASIAPDAPLDDVAHDIRPGDIRAAAWALRGYWRLFPEGTVHLLVVDPGVGGERRALAARLDGRFIVAPDNGAMTLALREAARAEIVALGRTRFFRDTVSSTFHGRDVFAPVAAHLARGVALDELGERLTNPVALVWPEPERGEEGAAGEVIHIDRFGNLVTNLPGAWAGAGDLVWVQDRTAGPVRGTYADVPSGEIVALIGSAGLIEVSVRDGSAAAELEAERGTAVRLRPAER